MKNISEVHMVDSWNGLKEVSVKQKNYSTEAMPDLKHDKLEAFGAVVSLGLRFEGKFLQDFSCCSFWQIGRRWLLFYVARGLHEVIKFSSSSVSVGFL